MKKVSKAFSRLGVACCVLTLLACEEHRLLVLEDVPENRVTVKIHWEGVPEQDISKIGMRLNLFGLNGLDFGMRDMLGDVETYEMPIDRIYRALCYDYYGSENIYFRNENNPDLIEAYSAQMNRASYDAVAPIRDGKLESTVAEPGAFYVARVDSFQVSPQSGDTLYFYPKNVLKTYTFTITNVEDAQNIGDTRGALTGMSGSYFLSTGALATTASTILFYAQKNGQTNTIEGSFRTFGRVADALNDFTIEILVGDIMMSVPWDVKQLMIEAENNGTYHFTMAANIVIPQPPAPGPGEGGFKPDVDGWGETVDVPM
ncbi:MAG: DUF5119 domain-containing protein [Candidatus Symbiothrix sp.]|nr:DUF5119 domain-containing protein [Candidatus Symbiothrix sp.]